MKNSGWMKQAARATWEAEKENRTLAPITDSRPGITLEEAYQVQILREEMMLAEGHRVIGGKMGLTSFAKMKQMGMDKSTYGRLFDYMLLAPEEDLCIGECLHPRVESEIAFILKADLAGPYLTSVEVMNATEYVSPAFEIIDSRYHDFKFRLCDGVIDNISAKRFKLSGKKSTLAKWTSSPQGSPSASTVKTGSSARAAPCWGTPPERWRPTQTFWRRPAGTSRRGTSF